MKKHLFSIPLLLLWNQAQAQQNTSTVNQAGNPQTGNATQRNPAGV